MATITSPAGETIEVVDDADFLELYDLRQSDLNIWNPKRPLLQTLWTQGAIEDRASGRATGILHERMRRLGYRAAQTGTASLLQSRAIMGCVDRELNGKRTYSIKLVRLPQTWVSRLEALKRSQPPAQEQRKEVTPPEPVTVAQPQPAEPAEVFHPEDIPEDVAAAVARELLAEVVRVINAPPKTIEVPVEAGPSRELIECRDRLSNALEYGNKLRRQLGETGDELRAVKTERDMLRQRLHIAEANMDKALGDGRRFVDAEVQKALGRIMSAKPGTDKGADDAE